MSIPFGSSEHRAQLKKEYAKRYREYYKSLSPEAKAEMKRNRESDKLRREEDRQEKARLQTHKKMLAKAKAVLSYMKKTDVLYYHHGKSESIMPKILKALDSLKLREGHYGDTVYFRIKDKEISLPRHDAYHPYIWNYQGEGRNYLPKCQFECIWRGPFESIYDVPLDGSYIFSIYDSGQRGLGSFDGITATKVTEKVYVPHVEPGGYPQITAF